MSRYPTAWLAAISELFPEKGLAIDSHEISAMTTEQLHQLGNMVTEELANREPTE
jgi:hypothetical protein